MHKVSLGCAWSSLVLGVFAFWSYISGYQRSLELPDVARPNVKRRLFKLLLALPALVYFIAPFVIVK